MHYADPSYAGRDEIIARFRRTRHHTMALASPLSHEDWMLQSMPDASPVKWNLAHTSWFFETFLLSRFLPDYTLFDLKFPYLFNSYYQQIGEMHPRPDRGALSRPSAADVVNYRDYVEAAMVALIETAPNDVFAQINALIDLGIAHEEQHQELLLTDIKHAMAQNPISPALYPLPIHEVMNAEPLELGWVSFDGGMAEIGASGDGFHFDNEGPAHQVFLHPFELATRAVTNGEFRDFIMDGGYEDSRLWLSDGWDKRCAEELNTPLYWRGDVDDWHAFTLFGEDKIDWAAPVCHISFYEAAAFAAWAGARLPTEFEWETASKRATSAGIFLEDGAPKPWAPARGGEAGGLSQMFGDVWEWTASAYLPYPRFAAAQGAIGEYNGKFMSGQMVLRGGSCATPSGHIRASYRNFFQANARWQFAGLRLARDID